jgi:hypothetical protein
MRSDVIQFVGSQANYARDDPNVDAGGVETHTTEGAVTVMSSLISGRLSDFGIIAG